MRKMVPCVLFASFLILATAAYCLWRSGGGLSGREPMVVWGRGGLTVSEMAYHADRINRIIQAWQLMSAEAAEDTKKHPDRPYEISLVVDTAKPALWIEDAGQILERFCVELPNSVDWQAQLFDANGLKDLGPTVRLKYPGPYTPRFRPEFFVFKGQSPTGAYIGVLFDCTFSCGARYGRGTFGFTCKLPPPRENVDYYDSMVVDREQHDPSALSWSRRGVRPATEQIDPFRENWAAWSNVETKLYRAIEDQVVRAGWTLRQLAVEPRWDYSGAEAKVHAVRQNMIERLLGGGRGARPNLRIDYLGDGVWYATSIRDSPPTPAGWGAKWEELPLEFLVSAGQPILPAERQKWIEKGRTKQNGETTPKP
jgi:hypothetical protein